MHRTGYNFLGPYLSYTWVPNKTVVAHGPYFESENYFNTGYEKIDYVQTLGYSVEFASRAKVIAGVKDFFVQLQQDFDPTRVSEHFLPAFVRYNEQIENMNINMRFQWRYAPVSDFFIVYTDNYFTGDWTSHNRALVMKLSYWFN